MEDESFDPIEEGMEPVFEADESDFEAESSNPIEGLSDADIGGRYDSNPEYSHEPSEIAGDGENIILEGSYDAETNNITVEGTVLQGDPEIIAAIAEQFRQGIDGTAYSTTFTYEGGLYQSDYVIDGSTLRIETALIPEEEEAIAEAGLDDDDSDSEEQTETQNLFSAESEENRAEAEMVTTEQAASSWANIFGNNNQESKVGLGAEAGTNAEIDLKDEEPGVAIPAELELDFIDLFWVKVDSSTPERITVKAAAVIKEHGSLAEPLGKFKSEVAHAKNGKEFVSLRKAEPKPEVELAKVAAEADAETAKQPDSELNEELKKEVRQDKALKTSEVAKPKREILQDPGSLEDTAENSGSTTVQAKKSLPKTNAKPIIKLKSQPLKKVSTPDVPRQPSVPQLKTPEMPDSNLEPSKQAQVKEVRPQPISLAPIPAIGAKTAEQPEKVDEAPKNLGIPEQISFPELADNINIEAPDIFASKVKAEETETLPDVTVLELKDEEDTIASNIEPGEIQELSAEREVNAPMETKEMDQTAKPIELMQKKVEPAIRLVKPEIVKHPNVKRENVNNNFGGRNKAEGNKKVLEFTRKEKPAEQYRARRAISRVIKTGPQFENSTGGIVLRYRHNTITAEERDRLERNNRIAKIPVNKVRQRIPSQRAAIKMAA